MYIIPCMQDGKPLLVVGHFVSLIRSAGLMYFKSFSLSCLISFFPNSFGVFLNGFFFLLFGFDGVAPPPTPPTPPMLPTRPTRPTPPTPTASPAPPASANLSATPPPARRLGAAPTRRLLGAAAPAKRAATPPPLPLPPPGAAEARPRTTVDAAGRGPRTETPRGAPGREAPPRGPRARLLFRGKPFGRAPAPPRPRLDEPPLPRGGRANPGCARGWRRADRGRPAKRSAPPLGRPRTTEGLGRPSASRRPERAATSMRKASAAKAARPRKRAATRSAAREAQGDTQGNTVADMEG